jgi:hypothetical protein
MDKLVTSNIRASSMGGKGREHIIQARSGRERRTVMGGEVQKSWRESAGREGEEKTDGREKKIGRRERKANGRERGIDKTRGRRKEREREKD